MTDIEKKLEETNNAIKELTIKLAGITMANVIIEKLTIQQPAVDYLLNNLSEIQKEFEERIKQ